MISPGIITIGDDIFIKIEFYLLALPVANFAEAIGYLLEYYYGFGLKEYVAIEYIRVRS